ncbi:MAG: hypothetical protein ABS49_05950 [Erythrobacter sp. SCN 62-14]|nr:MAG: hypothetical protein ABS49_05950 [Erythrobacter sp. SCN 62-14]
MSGPHNQDWVEDAKAEISAMGKEGLNHPSTKPVLIGAGIGAVAGALVLGGPLLGGLAGAGFALYQRIKK